MTISITKLDDVYIGIGSKDKRFQEAWGSVNRVSPARLFDAMTELAEWCNNTLKEEALFEVI